MFEINVASFHVFPKGLPSEPIPRYDFLKEHGIQPRIDTSYMSFRDEEFCRRFEPLTKNGDIFIKMPDLDIDIDSYKKLQDANHEDKNFRRGVLKMAKDYLLSQTVPDTLPDNMFERAPKAQEKAAPSKEDVRRENTLVAIPIVIFHILIFAFGALVGSMFCG